MKKHYIDALTYLYSFSEGLSRYSFDRALTYRLNYRIHPGEFVHYFKSENLLDSNNESSNYILSELGRIKVEENLNELKGIIDVIMETIDKCKVDGYDIYDTEFRPPYVSFSYKNKRFKILIDRSQEIEVLTLSLPSDVRELVNNITLSKENALRTDIIYDVIKAHLKMLDHNIKI